MVPSTTIGALGGLGTEGLFGLQPCKTYLAQATFSGVGYLDPEGHCALPGRLVASEEKAGPQISEKGFRLTVHPHLMDAAQRTQ